MKACSLALQLYVSSPIIQGYVNASMFNAELLLQSTLDVLPVKLRSSQTIPLPLVPGEPVTLTHDYLLLCWMKVDVV